MKRILSTVLMAVLAVTFASAGDVVTRDTLQLPLPARNFILQHFTDPQIAYIKIDNELFRGKIYEAVLVSGTEIEFDNRGEWTSIDTQKEAVPASVIPVYIKDYVSANFKNNFITQIERNRRYTEVELNNDLNLKFNRSGQLIKMDD